MREEKRRKREREKKKSGRQAGRQTKDRQTDRQRRLHSHEMEKAERASIRTERASIMQSL